MVPMKPPDGFEAAIAVPPPQPSTSRFSLPPASAAVGGTGHASDTSRHGRKRSNSSFAAVSGYRSASLGPSLFDEGTKPERSSQTSSSTLSPCDPSSGSTSPSSEEAMPKSSSASTARGSSDLGFTAVTTSPISQTSPPRQSQSRSESTEDRPVPSASRARPSFLTSSTSSSSTSTLSQTRPGRLQPPRLRLSFSSGSSTSEDTAPRIFHPARDGTAGQTVERNSGGPDREVQPNTSPLENPVTSPKTAPLATFTSSFQDGSPLASPIAPGFHSLPYRIPSFSRSEPTFSLTGLEPIMGNRPAPLVDFPGSVPPPPLLSPLEEMAGPMYSTNSPAGDLGAQINPFDTLTSLSNTSPTSPAKTNSSPKQDETFYHALLEIVRTEDGYTEDLTDLVEVHFSLLSFARFVTEEQRSLIIRDAAKLLEIHRRLQVKLQRVDEELGWIRDEEEEEPFSSGSTVPLGVQHFPSPRSKSRRFKSSDSTVFEAARRISSIFQVEAANLSEAYQPFCSLHGEAMEVVRNLSLQRVEWDAFEAQCTAQLALRKAKSTRLRFADFLIKPVQRICRYPLLFSALWRHAPIESITTERVAEAVEVLKEVASQVDHAQRRRSLEIATVKLALRIDILNPEVAKLINHLDQVVLIGSGHVIHTNAAAPIVATSSTPTVKAAFFGLVLYTTHLVFLKAKKTKVYEPKHWLPLRVFEVSKVPDGEGLLPYAIRLSYKDLTFEIGSLCHAEQNIWAETIEETAASARRRWLETVSTNPAVAAHFDESALCSETVSHPSLLENVSPIITTASESGVSFPGSPDPSIRPVSPSAFSGAPLVATTVDEPVQLRPRLSLKPPAQRVAVDLRLADLLSDSILSARAQSKRSHAMPLHGPPPRSMTTPGTARSQMQRPHSFHTGAFNYRSMFDGSVSRTTSIAESDGGRPSLRSMFTASQTASPHAGAMPVETEGSQHGRKSRLQRSRTSTQIVDQVLSSSGTLSGGKLGKLRKRSASLAPGETGTKLMVELDSATSAEQQKQYLLQQQQMLEAGEKALNADGEVNVARNSSTSSSSSYASSSTGSHGIRQTGTPQSSLPASPLLTPVDLEGGNRWHKLGDAISSLSRKRSFASARPILAVQPEQLLEGIQLSQAQEAAEYIYTGNATGSGSGHGHSRSNSHVYGQRPGGNTSASDRRYSWDKLMGGGSNSGGYTSTRVGRSAPSLTMEKRQSSSGSLWSVFRGESLTSSPTPSIYESAHEDDDAPTSSATASSFGSRSHSSSRNPSPKSSFHQPSTGGYTYTTIASSSPVPTIATSPSSTFIGRSVSSTGSKSASSSPSTLSPPATASESRPSSIIKRKNSISARIRAFKALGSSMTPLST